MVTNYRKVFHAVTSFRTHSFPLESDRAQFISKNHISNCVFLESFISENEWHELRYLLDSQGSYDLLSDPKNKENESSIFPTDRHSQLLLLRFFYRDVGWISTETAEDQFIHAFINRLIKYVQPTDEELKAKKLTNA